jgi:hypothetical protein
MAFGAGVRAQATRPVEPDKCLSFGDGMGKVSLSPRPEALSPRQILRGYLTNPAREAACTIL